MRSGETWAEHWSPFFRVASRDDEYSLAFRTVFSTVHIHRRQPLALGPVKSWRSPWILVIICPPLVVNVIWVVVVRLFVEVAAVLLAAARRTRPLLRSRLVVHLCPTAAHADVIHAGHQNCPMPIRSSLRYSASSSASTEPTELGEEGFSSRLSDKSEGAISNKDFCSVRVSFTAFDLMLYDPPIIAGRTSRCVPA